MDETVLEPAMIQPMNNRQRLFIRYFTAILVDLAVLNLFNEHWQHVQIDSFTLSLFAAVLLQALLQGTLLIEHKVSHYFNAIGTGLAKFMRFFSAWLILFLSKFVILGAIKLAFGESVNFGGPLHGVVAFIVVVFTMLGAEELIIRFYRRLA